MTGTQAKEWAQEPVLKHCLGWACFCNMEDILCVVVLVMVLQGHSALYMCVQVQSYAHTPRCVNTEVMKPMHTTGYSGETTSQGVSSP